MGKKAALLSAALGFLSFMSSRQTESILQQHLCHQRRESAGAVQGPRSFSLFVSMYKNIIIGRHYRDNGGLVNKKGKLIFDFQTSSG